MNTDDGRELRTFDASLHVEGSEAAQGLCRFAPFCAEGRKSHEDCPDNPAAFSERVGGITVAGPARYVAICRPRAIKRFSLEDVLVAEAEVTPSA